MNISKKEKRLLVGQVVSNKMQKTVVVETERAFTHPVFHKIVRVTKKYKVHTLVYFEQTIDIKSAIQREKQLKRWKRKWKLELIEKHNPEWQDLYNEL